LIKRVFPPEPHAISFNKDHHRIETRTLTLIPLPIGALSFPFIEQACRIERTRESIADGKITTETVYCITSREKNRASPEQLLKINREHWGIESLHHIRDVSFDEDRSQIRTKNGPRVMASLRNLVIALIRRLKVFKTIPAAFRKFSFGSKRQVMSLLGIL